MKKTFLAKRNALLSPGDFSVGALALTIVVVLALVRIIFPNVFWSATAPVLRTTARVSAGVHSLQAGFKHAAALEIENERIVQDNAALMHQNQALQEENDALRSLLGNSATAHTRADGILAGVLSRPPESPYDTLVLSSGALQGVMPRMAAYGPGNVPLGIVTDVLSNYARVTLFSAPGETFAAWVGTARVPVTLTGAGAGAFDAIISRAAGVKVGDAVFGPGPGALPVGTVARIDDEPASPTLTLRIAPAANLFSLTWVELREAGAALKDAFSSGASTTP